MLSFMGWKVTCNSCDEYLYAEVEEPEDACARAKEKGWLGFYINSETEPAHFCPRCKAKLKSLLCPAKIDFPS